MEIKIIDSLSNIRCSDWNALVKRDYPFIKYEFLFGLEKYQCVGAHFGWLPRHVVVFDQAQLIGAMPLYLKFNSYGEFVFDWAWADVYQRYGHDYYPKLVCSIPYTPISGPRFLLLDGYDYHAIFSLMIAEVLKFADDQAISSIHWLFLLKNEHQFLMDQGFLERNDCQFHWYNQNYQDFDQFLMSMSSRKRKKIKRERRQIQDAGIKVRIAYGDELSLEAWQKVYQFYQVTFLKKSGMPTLSFDFFQYLAEVMGRQLVIVMAEIDQQMIACAINFRDDNSLYGRHWGCDKDYHSLHFELCYYQGIDYCIAQQLQTFEPGAQGEHKLSRGFLPTQTQSAHWIAREDFKSLIQHQVIHEKEMIQLYMEELNQQSPYKK